MTYIGYIVLISSKGQLGWQVADGGELHATWHSAAAAARDLAGQNPGKQYAVRTVVDES